MGSLALSTALRSAEFQIFLMMPDSTTTVSPVTIVAEDVFIKLVNRVVINNFLKEIDERAEVQPGERDIHLPEFEIAGFKFGIKVRPKESPGHVGIYLHNRNDVDLTASFHIKCLEPHRLENHVIGATQGWGWPKIFSHAKFKTWAEKNKEDSLVILATITLHLTGEKQTELVTNRKRN